MRQRRHPEGLIPDRASTEPAHQVRPAGSLELPVQVDVLFHRHLKRAGVEQEGDDTQHQDGGDLIDVLEDHAPVDRTERGRCERLIQATGRKGAKQPAAAACLPDGNAGDQKVAIE